MVFLLYLGHGLLGLAGLALRGTEVRKRVVPLLAGVGIALGLLLFLIRHTGAEWRTTTVEPGPAAAAGLAAACAWLLLLLFDRSEGRWEPVVLTGVASCGLTLFAVNDWTVPALLFWWASSIAIAVAVRANKGRVQLWLTIAISDLLLTAAFVSHSLDTETWHLPRSIGGLSLWLLVSAALVRAGLIPRIADWGRGDAYVWPLLAGGPFALVTGVAGREEPWVALALLLVALGAAALLLVQETVELSAALAWPVALMLAALFVVPGAPWQAAAAGLIAGTSVLLWPLSEGRAQVERGLLLAFLPPSAGFSAIVAAAVASFDQATATTDVVKAAPWTAITALLPAAVAAGVVVGARVGRRAEAERYQPSGVIATWALFVALVLAGLWPRIAGTSFVSSKTVTVNVVAVLIGVAAARWAVQPQMTVPAEPADPGTFSFISLPRRAAVVLEWVAGAVGVLAFIVMLWLTVRGLQVGFL